MTKFKQINNFVDKIHALNSVEDGFWRDYLDRIRNGMKVTWYHSSGFDLRPLFCIRELTSFGQDYAMNCNEFDKIGKELQKTDIVFSDRQRHFYDSLLNLWSKRESGLPLDCPPADGNLIEFIRKGCQCLPGESAIYDLFSHNKHNHCKSYFEESLLSIKPFRLFSNNERKELVSSVGVCLNDYARANDDARAFAEFTEHNREYDGFAIQTSGFSSSHITIIFLCLDDRIVKKLFDDYQIDVVGIFENATGLGLGGSLPLSWLYPNPKDLEKVKYIFTDEFQYDEEQKRLILGYDYIENAYAVKNYLFGRTRTALRLTDNMGEECGIGAISFKMTKFVHRDDKWRFEIELEKKSYHNGIGSLFTDSDYILMNYLFGLISGELRLTSDAMVDRPAGNGKQEKYGHHGDGFCLAVKKQS